MLTTLLAGSCSFSSSTVSCIDTARHPILRPRFSEAPARSAIFCLTEECDAETAWCTTASGLRFVEEQVGQGEELRPTQVVRVAYQGELLSDGRRVEFGDAGAKSPIIFRFGDASVPSLWSEAIAGMRVGGRRKLMVPPSSKYRPEAAAGVIQDGETIRFELELLGIEAGAGAVLATLTSGLGSYELPLPFVDRTLTLTRKGALRLAIVLLSFLPYLLPEDVKPGLWKGGDNGMLNQIDAVLEAPPPTDVLGMPLM